MKKLMKSLRNNLDDLLLMAGCGCVLYGLSMWNAVITWVVGGLMLGGWAFMLGKVESNESAE